MRLVAHVLLAFATLSAGTAAAEEEWSPKPLQYMGPRRTAEEPPPNVPRGGGVDNIIYINRCAGGCTITKGPRNDSTIDASWFPIGEDGDTYTITEFAHDQATWDAIMECVRDVYSYYDIEVTDVDPGTAPHTEVYAAGLSEEIGHNSGGLGGAVQPTVTIEQACSPAFNNIGFAFLNGYPASQVEYMCGVIAQESGHSFGMLDHVRDCNDPMSYSYYGPCRNDQRGYFRNRPMKCGDAGDEPCTCGSNTVNYHQHLLTSFGPGTGEAEAPTGTILNPDDGAPVTDVTPFMFSASSNRGVYRAELFLNDWRWAEWDAPDHISPSDDWPPPMLVVDPPNGFPDGVIDVYYKLYDDIGTEGMTNTVTVIRGSPCDNAGDCADGQQCAEGKCFWDAPTGELGEACEFDQECIGLEVYDGLCIDTKCSRECSTQLAGDCDEGFECDPTNPSEGLGVCVPVPDTGCCSTGRDTPSGMLGMLGVMSIAGLGLFRRRRGTR